MTGYILDFDILADHKVKIKERERRVKYFDFARELRKHWDMWMTVIPVLIGVLGTAPKGFERGQEILEIRTN